MGVAGIDAESHQGVQEIHHLKIQFQLIQLN